MTKKMWFTIKCGEFLWFVYYDIQDLKLPLGFTFSFPCEQEGLAKARLVKWTKGFSCTGSNPIIIRGFQPSNFKIVWNESKSLEVFLCENGLYHLYVILVINLLVIECNFKNVWCESQYLDCFLSKNWILFFQFRRWGWGCCHTSAGSFKSPWRC